MRKLKLLLMTILVLCTSIVRSQTRTVTGTVLDESQTPIPNASVLIKGTNTGAATSNSGEFSITVPSGSNILVVTAVGKESKEVSIDNAVNLTIILSSGNDIIEEVVVTGYGNRKRSQFAGAVSIVEAKKIEQVPIASFEQILQGRVPGLYIASGSGQPGSTNTRVNIRGVGSINGSNDPLYVLDGIPIESGVFRSLNPNDFESIEVLKDAAGASVYGSRGANGVIVITSKKGRSGAARIQYRGMMGFAEPPKLRNVELMNTQQRLEYEEKIVGPKLFPTPTGLLGLPGWDYSKNNPYYQSRSATEQGVFDARLDSIRNINTDWPGIFTRRAKFKQHEVNASGGNETMSYFSSLSAYNQEGILQRSDLDRYTFRTNLDFKTKKLTVAVRSTAGWSSLNGIESEAGVALANPIAAAFLELPYTQFRNPGSDANLVGSGRIGANAYDRIFTTTSVANQFKGNLGITALYKIGAGFGVKMINGVDWRNTNNSRFVDPNSFAGKGAAPATQGSYSESNSENLQLVNTTGFTYDNTFNGKHRVSAQVMMETIRNKNRTHTGVGYGLNLKMPNTPAAITQGTATNNFIGTFSGGKSQNGLFSYFAIVDYSFDGKYTLNASVRRDAPSQVPKENRNNIFWGLGGSWNVLKESFMQDQSLFNELRLRASYGETGNIGGFPSDFGYFQLYGATSYAGTPGIFPSAPGNPLYRLESQLSSNIGLDFALLRSRLRASLDYYTKTSQNLFVSQNLSRQTGFTALNTNAGEMQNKGFEFDLRGDVISGNDILLTLYANGAFNRNEITSLGGLPEIPAGTGIYKVGYPFGTHWVVGWSRVEPETGDPIYLDANGQETKVFSAANNLPNFGTYLPKFTGGFGLDFMAKGFDLNLFFTTAQGVKRFNNESFFYESTNANISYNKSIEMLYNTWTTPGQITNYQRINTQRQFSSKDILDASFIRMRNATIGYTVPQHVVKVIRGVRVWAQGQNLFTWTKWKGFDPEESNNIATYEFPNPTTVTFGLDINF